MAKNFPRGLVDKEGLQGDDMLALRDLSPSNDIPFGIKKIGHVVLLVMDVARSADFYTKVLGFQISDVYPESMMPGRMVFLRFNKDHHGVALVGGAQQEMKNAEMHHMAFEVETLDEVFSAQKHLQKHNVKIEFAGRRRAGCQVAVEFRDPDGHFLEIYWGLDQVAPNENARPPEEWLPANSLKDAVENAPPGQDTTLSDPSLKT